MSLNTSMSELNKNQPNQHNSFNYDYLYCFKFIVVGDSSCGKTCLLLRLVDNKFDERHDMTIGVEFGIYKFLFSKSENKNQIYRFIPTNSSNNGHCQSNNSEITISNKFDNAPIKLHVWDCAGQENFRSITRSYFRNSAGCLLVYDVSRSETFRNIEIWLNDIRNHCHENLVITLVANKVDLVSRRIISREEGENLAKKYGLEYIETSAKTGVGVKQAFENTAIKIVEKIDAGDITHLSDANGIRQNGKIAINGYYDNSQNKSSIWNCWKFW